MWEKAILSDVCKIYQPKTISKKEMVVEGKYVVFGANGIIGRYNDYNHEFPQVIIGCRGSCGAIAMSEPFSWITGNAMVCSPKDDNKLLKEFLFYSLLNIDFATVITGTAQPQITRTSIENKAIPIFFPILKEQEKIVTKLDKVFTETDKAIKATKNKKQEIEALKSATLKDCFDFSKNSCELKKLGDMLKTSSGGTPLKSRKEYYENGKINWLLSGAVCRKEIIESETYITELGLKNSNAKIFPPNTVLIAMYGATAGQVGILRIESTTNQAICGIYPNEDYLPDFLYYYFLDYKETLLKEARGSAQPNLSQEKIKNVRVPIVSLAEQEKIVVKLDKFFAETKKIEVIYKKKIEDLHYLKSAFIREELQGDVA